ncbi:MAG: hypothetical protein SPF89_07055 [Sphaerochaetaceae bacterium]|nr:hypothetical protein [Spirochaetales bacterium]MDY5499845.1 hypothetical protein [Sphaerochaetaceae bacterium]
MKKSSIVMLVIASLLVLFGVGIMIGSAVPYQFVRYYGGYTIRYSSNFGEAYQLARLMVGGFMFLGGMVFFSAVAIVQALGSYRKKEVPAAKAVHTEEVPKVSVKAKPVEEQPKVETKPAQSENA